MGSAGGGILDGGAGNDALTDFDYFPYWDYVYEEHLNMPVNRSHVLRGGAGNDSLRSSGGADVLDGGAGNDVLTAFKWNRGPCFREWLRTGCLVGYQPSRA